MSILPDVLGMPHYWDPFRPYARKLTAADVGKEAMRPRTQPGEEDPKGLARDTFLVVAVHQIPLCAFCGLEPEQQKEKQQKNRELLCGRCERVSYCSKECQQADWEARHAKECIKGGGHLGKNPLRRRYRTDRAVLARLSAETRQKGESVVLEQANDFHEWIFLDEVRHVKPDRRKEPGLVQPFYPQESLNRTSV